MPVLSTEDLIEEVYSGASCPLKLKAALQRAVTLIGANGGNIHVVDKADLSSALFVAVGGNYTPEAIETYFNHWRHVNPYRAALRRARGVFACHEQMDERDLARSPYAQDFYFQMGERWLAGAVAQSDPHHEVSLVFNRAQSQGVFGARDQAFIAELLPHVRRAASLLVSGAYKAALADGVNLSFAASVRPAWMVNADLKLVWFNPSAEEMLRGARIARDMNGHLELADERAHARLKRLARIAAGRKLEGAMSQSLYVGEGEDGLELSVLPATIPDGALRGAQSLVLVLGRALGLKSNADEILGKLFGLTPTEQKLALAVAHGVALEEAAAGRGVSFETVRSQMRSIYAKTATHRQSELAALVWRLCGS